MTFIIAVTHLDFTDEKIFSKLKERINILSGYRSEFDKLYDSLRQNVTGKFSWWLQQMQAIPPNLENMSLLEMANYYLSLGDIDQARKAMESFKWENETMSPDSFALISKIYIKIGMQDTYINLYNRFCKLFDIIIPNFNQLNKFVDQASYTIVRVRALMSNKKQSYGSGFSISTHLIVTNRRTIEGAKLSDLTIMNEYGRYTPTRMEILKTNDLAIIEIMESLPYFRSGPFDFLEPGEKVFTMGFPLIDNDSQSENLKLSEGIVNSIRKTDISPERVIFTDANIRDGMNGGPLINNLGQVVGIITIADARNSNILDTSYVERQIEGLKKFRDIALEKLEYLKEAAIKESKGEHKFKLKEDIKSAEEDLRKAEEEISEKELSITKISAALPVYLINNYIQ